jgi:hypothetical protein
MRKKLGITLGTAGAVAALVLVGAAPANAWGGPTNFGSGCNAYSVNPTSDGRAGAHTLDVNNVGYALRVAFRGGGHTDINPITGTNVVRSYIQQSVVSTYNVAGGYHKCSSWTYAS